MKFNDYQRVVLIACLVDKLSSSDSLINPQDAYAMAIEKARQNPEILEEMHHFMLKSIARGNSYGRVSQAAEAKIAADIQSLLGKSETPPVRSQDESRKENKQGDFQDLLADLE